MKAETADITGERLFLDGDLAGIEAGGAYSDAIVGPDGMIYCTPLCASKVARINPKTKEVTLIGHDLGIDMWKWRGSVLASDGKIYCACDNDHPGKMLCIDPQSSQKTKLFEPKGVDTMGGYCGAFEGTGKDGKMKIFCMPFWRAPHNVLVFDPDTGISEEVWCPRKSLGGGA